MSIALPIVNVWRYVLAISLVLWLTACTALSSTPSVRADASVAWALLPIANLSTTPQADSQAQTLMETQLRTRGVNQIRAYMPVQAVSLRALLDQGKQMDDALNWARRAGYRYGVTGTINEWSYRAGPDKEPVIGLNLKLVDVITGDVLWQGNGSRTGWGYAGLLALADSVMADLLDRIELDNTRY